jgi:hypothetical protein
MGLVVPPIIDVAEVIGAAWHTWQSAFLICREHSRNIQGTFKEYSGEHSGNIQGAFREHSGNIQVELSGRP